MKYTPRQKFQGTNHNFQINFKEQISNSKTINQSQIATEDCVSVYEFLNKFQMSKGQGPHKRQSDKYPKNSKF